MRLRGRTFNSLAPSTPGRVDPDPAAVAHGLDFLQAEEKGVARTVAAQDCGKLDSLCHCVHRFLQFRDKGVLAG